MVSDLLHVETILTDLTNHEILPFISWAYYTSGRASVTAFACAERKIVAGTHFRFLERETRNVKRET